MDDADDIITDDELNDYEVALLDIDQFGPPFYSAYDGPDLPPMLHANDPERCIGEEFWGHPDSCCGFCEDCPIPVFDLRNDDGAAEDDLTLDEVDYLDRLQFGVSKWGGATALTEYTDDDGAIVDFLEYALGFPFDELAE